MISTVSSVRRDPRLGSGPTASPVRLDGNDAVTGLTLDSGGVLSAWNEGAGESALCSERAGLAKSPFRAALSPRRGAAAELPPQPRCP